MKFPLLIASVVACSLAADAYAQQPTPRAKQSLKQAPPPRVKGAPVKDAAPNVNKATGGGTSFVGPNDNCASATAISGPGPFAFDTVGANTDGPSNCGLFTADVWFNWTAGATATFQVDLCSGVAYDSEVAVYSGASCVGALIACDDDFCSFAGPSRVTFSATMGSVYKIQIGGYNGANGTGSFSITQPPPPPPPSQDDCSTAAAISGPGPHPFNNLSATTGSQGQTNAACNFFATTGIDNDVWFKWTAGTTGGATLSLCGTANGMDSKVAIYAGGACPSAGAIACNDDACGLESGVTWCIQNGQTYLIQLGNYPGATGNTGTFAITTFPAGTGNDECAGAVALGATGPYAFNNTAATTGCAGQSNANCNFFGQPGIDNDVWFTWTAGSSGNASLTLCGTTGGMDSKVAVYTGAGCPTGQALACNDDSCALESRVCFPVTNGQAYTIQLGNYPGAAGSSGTFDITVSQPSPCQKDDGSSENSLGWTAGGDMVWLQRFGGGGSTSVSNVQIVYGTAAFPGASPANGSPVRIALWDDPNDDGDPSDAVLLQTVNTTVANVDTDIFNTVSIPATSVSGVFFVGASEVHASGEFVASMDEGCVTPGAAWFFGNNNATPADLANVNNNAQLPATFDSIGLPANLLLRAGCDLSPLTGFCFPNAGGIRSCPCANQPVPNDGTRGCNNYGPTPAGGTGGAILTASGDAIASTASSVVFHVTGMQTPCTIVVLFAGTTTLSPGVQSGAGVRCLAGLQVPRPYKSAAGFNAGSINFPSASSNPNVSAWLRSNSPAPGTTKHYYAAYRNPQAGTHAPCTPTNAFNLTNAGTVLWHL